MGILLKTFYTLAIFCFVNNAYCQKVNDETAFISGDFDRKILAENRIMAIDVTNFIDGRKLGKRYFEFDENGQLSLMVYRNAQDEMVGIHSFFFDENNDLKKMISMNLLTGINDTIHYFRVYKNDLLISDSSSDSEFVTKFIYNEKGLVAEEMNDYSGKSFGKMFSNQYFYYDEKNRKTESKRYFTSILSEMKPELTSHTEMVYNEKGWLTAENEKVAKSETGSTFYEYDEKGRCVRVTKEKGETRSFTYNANGLLVTKTTKMSDFDMEMTHHYNYRFEYPPQ
jgi:YD repeat-containing protein